jgi:aminoglycoside phosphotransferase family enzyme/gluconate kinase
MLEPGAYPHPCTAIELIETHISWVLLTGDYAYKLKKPVRFAFLDFSSPEQREHFCREELRCNRAFAPALYRDVVPVVQRASGTLAVGGPSAAGDTPLEWAVQMRQFDPAAQLDRLLEREALSAGMLADFGGALAELHAGLPRLQAPVEELQERTFAPVHDNFSEIAATGLEAEHSERLAEVATLSAAQEHMRADLLAERLHDGYVRECHGDLHLANLALIDGAVTAFDCLEFNPLLRWIDTFSDVAFLFMDCHERGRADLAYTFLNAYLNASGDYRGAELLTYFAAYRSLVRAKVAALRWQQAQDADSAAQFRRYVEWAHTRLARPTGSLVLMCGLSGAGKSYVAERLAPRLPGVHLRSDVARKALAGLNALDHSNSPVGGGLYTAARSDAVFAHLTAVARELLGTGEHVIVDATFIEHERRAALLAMAQEADAPAHVVWCTAPDAVLRERIATRAAAGRDASEASLDVLAAQQAKFDPPGAGEPVIEFATDQPLDDAALDALVAQLHGDTSAHPL